jgi:large subunit ribosomal protein L4
VKAKRLVVIDEFRLAGIKTKPLVDIVKKLELEQVLIVDDANKNLEFSGRNIPRVKVLRTEGLNVYDVIRNDWVVLTKRAAEAVQTRLAKEGK